MEEIVKQGTTYGPVSCCATTVRVNYIREIIYCKYGDTEISMSVFMEVDRIDERVQQGTVLETDRYKYRGTVVNTEGNLKDHL